MANLSVAAPAGESFFTHLFSPSGRTNRAKFWLAILVYMLVYAVVLLFVVGMPQVALSIPGIVIMAIAGLAITISSLIVSIRRLHDRDRSGHWLWLLYGVPTVLNVVGNVVLQTNPQLLLMGGMEVMIAALLMTVLSLGFSIWAIVELGCLRGTQGPNRFGSDPLQA